MPLLRVEPIADAELGAGPWAAVLFTSANAVRAVAAHRRFGELADLPVYTVGRRTQAAAAAAGFVSIVSADGDVNALVRLIASRPRVRALTGGNLRRGVATNSSPPPCGEGFHPNPPPQGGRESRRLSQRLSCPPRTFPSSIVRAKTVRVTSKAPCAVAVCM